MEINKFRYPFLGLAGNSGFGAYLLTLMCCFSFFLLIQYYLIPASGQIQSEYSAWYYFLQLIPFSIFLVLLLFFATFFHRRSLLSFLTGHTGFKWKRTLFCFGYWIAFNAIIELINSVVFNHQYTFSFDIVPFFNLVAISLVFLSAQSAAEEVFVRGYLLQAICSHTNKIWLGLAGTSLVFLLLHNSNPENEQYGYWLMSSIYFTTGLLFAIFTVLGNGLEIAIGLHAANNFYTAVFVNFDSSALKTASLFHTKFDTAWPTLIANLSGLLLLYFILRKLNWIQTISAITNNTLHESYPA